MLGRLRESNRRPSREIFSARSRLNLGPSAPLYIHFRGKCCGRDVYWILRQKERLGSRRKEGKCSSYLLEETSDKYLHAALIPSLLSNTIPIMEFNLECLRGREL